MFIIQIKKKIWKTTTSNVIKELKLKDSKEESVKKKKKTTIKRYKVIDVGRVRGTKKFVVPDV